MSAWSNWPPPISRHCLPTPFTIILAASAGIDLRSVLADEKSRRARTISEAAQYADETISARRDRPSGYTPMGHVHQCAAVVYLLQGDWPRGAFDDRARNGEYLELGTLVLRCRHGIAFSAWCSAQLGEAGEALDLLREGAGTCSSASARDTIRHFGRAYLCYGSRRICYSGRLDDAQRLADRSSSLSRRVLGTSPTPAARWRHRDPCRPVRRRDR